MKTISKPYFLSHPFLFYTEVVWSLSFAKSPEFFLTFNPHELSLSCTPSSLFTTLLCPFFPLDVAKNTRLAELRHAWVWEISIAHNVSCLSISIPFVMWFHSSFTCWGRNGCVLVLSSDFQKTFHLSSLSEPWHGSLNRGQPAGGWVEKSLIVPAENILDQHTANQPPNMWVQPRSQSQQGASPPTHPRFMSKPS